MSKEQEVSGSNVTRSGSSGEELEMTICCLKHLGNKWTNNFVMTTLLDRIERLEAKDREETKNKRSGDRSSNGETNERRRGSGMHRMGFGQHEGRNEGVRIENIRDEEHNEDEWGNEDVGEEFDFSLYNHGGRGFQPPRGRRGGTNYRNWDYGVGEGAEERVDSNVGSIKIKIPPFHEKKNPDLYLEWERQVKLIFECHNYSEEKKVKLAAIEFKDYVIVWWDQLLVRRRTLGLRPIVTWEAMKEVMRERFVPQHYFRELHQRLQKLSQGSKSVEEYYKAMEVALARTQLEEPMEATMARFLAGLNMEIAHVVELHSYNTLTEMVHIAIKVEKQLKMKRSLKYGSGSFAATTKNQWKLNVGKVEKSEKELPIQKKEEWKGKEKWKGKGKVEDKEKKGVPTRAREVKCFKCLGRGHYANQCPNQRVMFMREDGGIERGDEVEEEETPNLAEYEDEEELVMGKQDPMVGLSYAMVTMRALSAQVSVEDGDTIQRENIFHSRCAVNDKLCSDN